MDALRPATQQAVKRKIFSIVMDAEEEQNRTDKSLISKGVPLEGHIVKCLWKGCSNYRSFNGAHRECLWKCGSDYRKGFFEVVAPTTVSLEVVLRLPSFLRGVP
ncbi:hypothetical protein JTE90_025203 [Oedothorax gibbosus]|uniref:Uncharacterized protein n=1 Tax=Oedothorax gibbosus TaxID=931172 RepID=A0AAV6UTU0_9ARAC|nr:hypothetical protein JTE90_025203 [Oedothorax gibbosus]